MTESIPKTLIPFILDHTEISLNRKIIVMIDIESLLPWI